MKFTFVNESDIPKPGKQDGYRWDIVIEELYKYPNQWVLVDTKVSHTNTAYRLADKFANIEVRVSGGNNLGLYHPDKKMWNVYLMYRQPEVDNG